jgi:hypothetical protein
VSPTSGIGASPEQSFRSENRPSIYLVATVFTCQIRLPSAVYDSHSSRCRGCSGKYLHVRALELSAAHKLAKGVALALRPANRKKFRVPVGYVSDGMRKRKNRDAISEQKKIFDGQPQSLYKSVTWRVGRATGVMQGQRKWFDGAQKPALYRRENLGIQRLCNKRIQQGDR